MADRGRQIVRQWRVLMMLENARRSMTVAELHAALDGECDRRTVYRDLDQLCQAGFPLVDSEGRWRVLQPSEGGWSIPLHPTELLALALAEDLVGASRGSWLQGPIGALRDKLLSVLTPRGRAYFSELRAASVATVFGAPDYRDRGGLLLSIHQCICRNRVIRIGHTALGKRRTVRDVEPYSLWFHEGVCYLVARCLLRSAIRTFAVERIDSAEVLDQRFVPDQSFDPASYVREAFGPYHGPIVEASIDFSPRLAHLVQQRRYHHTQVTDTRPDGGVRMTIRAGGLSLIAAWIAGFGGDARPIGPPELVHAVREIHEAGLAAIQAVKENL